MASPEIEQMLQRIHQDELAAFDRIWSASTEERRQSLEDRRFYSIAGAQWEGELDELFSNKPRPEVNKVHLSVIRIINEYRNNRISVDFVPKDGASNIDLADTCDGLYRADEQDSCAEEAYDNAFEEAVGGGFGAFRITECYENEEDDEDERLRIRFEPIYDADSSVFFDLGAKRQSKSDAKRCYVIYSMTREDYEEEWNDDPASWPKPNFEQYQFDWCTPDLVYLAEVYKVEDVRETIRTFSGIEEERKLSDNELADMGYDLAEGQGLEIGKREAIDMAISFLAGDGFVETKKRRRKTRRVHKYIMSGGKVLEDCGYIAGKNIPIVPVYGKRWYIDGIERFMGHVRLAKDVQRMKNVVVSWLEEIAAQSAVEKPIFTPEQMAGHEQMWSDDIVERYSYLLINPIEGIDGSSTPAGPIGYTKAPTIPQALAALSQMLDADMAEILGKPGEGDKMISNISGKAVEMIQQRLDMQAFIYLSNFAKAMQRAGEIWLSKAKETYPEEKRDMKSIGELGNIESVRLNERIVDPRSGDLTQRNDLTNADFDVAVDVGPSFTSRRDATVRGLTGVLQMTKDAQDAKILNALIMMNMEGEGLNDVREFYRKQLVAMGVLQPNEEEREAMKNADKQQQPSPQDKYLLAEAGKSAAEAQKAQADTALKAAQTGRTEAETAKIVRETEGMTNAPTPE